MLTALAASASSGEVIAVSDPCEVHVYLQKGRVAWATDSTKPFAFSRYLLVHTSLTSAVFQEVLASCRRDRLPLGETLIAWNLASRDEVRKALSHQIREALGSLRKSDAFQALFLERGRAFASYDTSLTFDLDEVLPRATAPRKAATPSMPAPTAGRVADRLRAALPEGTCIEVRAPDGGVQSHPEGSSSFVPQALARKTLLDGADTVTFRTGRRTVLGVSMAGSCTAWCSLDAEAAYGAVLTTLSSIARQWRSRPSMQFHVNLDAPRPLHTVGDSRDPHRDGAIELMTELMNRAEEVEGVFVVEGDDVRCGAVRESSRVERFKGLIAQRVGALSTNDAPASNSGFEGLGYNLTSLSTREPDTLVFGTEMATGTGCTVWIFARRDSRPGLGWAYLASLARSLSQAPSHEGAGE